MSCSCGILVVFLSSQTAVSAIQCSPHCSAAVCCVPLCAVHSAGRSNSRCSILFLLHQHLASVFCSLCSLAQYSEWAATDFLANLALDVKVAHSVLSLNGPAAPIFTCSSYDAFIRFFGFGVK
jgi:hypothetical protein